MVIIKYMAMGLFKMNYKITGWNGKKDFNLDLIWKGYEIELLEIYRKELELNLKYQIS